MTMIATPLAPRGEQHADEDDVDQRRAGTS